MAVLLEGGADPDVAEATTATPLHYAAAGHGGRTAAVLAAHGAPTPATAAPRSPLDEASDMISQASSARATPGASNSGGASGSHPSQTEQLRRGGRHGP